ncbi:MAG: hypothetical protein ABI467_17380 [Kofleriaceae bacterium]
MRKPFSIASLVCLPLIACGGSDNNTKTVKTVDSAKAVDAAVACQAAAMYPTLGNMGYGLDFPEDMTTTPPTAHAQVMVETLNATDVVFLQLNAGFGGFGSGAIVAGTYALAGDDLDPTACGLCFYVWPKSLTGTSLSAVNSAYLMTEQYMAVSGSITLTQAGGSAGSGSGHLIAGSVSNVTFKHATIASDGTLAYNADGCTTSVGSGGFGYPLQMGGSGSAAPDAEIHANGFDMPAGVVKLRRRSVD